MKSGLIMVAVACVAWSLPAAAEAATRFVDGAVGVDETNDCLSAGTPCRTITRAVTAAADGVDEIRIAAGTYDESVVADKRLTFVGSDVGATRVSPVAPGADAFVLPRGGTLRSLHAVGAAGVAGVGGYGIRAEPVVDGEYALLLENVVSRGGSSAPLAPYASGGLAAVSGGAARRINVSVVSGRFTGAGGTSLLPGAGIKVEGPGSASLSDVTASGGTHSEGVGAAVSRGAAVDIRNSSLEGSTASSIGLVVTDATAHVRNSTLEGKRHGVLVTGTTGATTVDIANSVVAASTSLPPGDPLVTGSAVLAHPGATASLTATGTTIVADGSSADGAVLARGTGGGVSSVVLRNSIARLRSSSELAPGDVVAESGATVSASSSSYTSVRAANASSVTPAGTAGNVSGDPGFSPRGFSLARSPLIDAGDASFVSPGEMAYNDVPRSLDGTGDCIAVPDIGAYEKPALTCRPPRVNQPPRLLGVSLSPPRFTTRKPTKPGRKRGTSINFRLSERAKVTILIERRTTGRRVKLKGRRRCVKLRPRNRRASKCVRHVKVGTLKLSGKAARNKKRFSGRVGGKLLKPGSYRMSLVATDIEGAKSRTVMRAFRVLEP